MQVRCSFGTCDSTQTSYEAFGEAQPHASVSYREFCTNDGLETDILCACFDLCCTAPPRSGQPSLSLDAHARRGEVLHAVNRSRPRHIGFIYYDVFRFDTPLSCRNRRHHPCSFHCGGHRRRRAIFGMIAYSASSLGVAEGRMADTAGRVSAGLGFRHGSSSRAMALISRNNLWYAGKTDLCSSVENARGTRIFIRCTERENQKKDVFFSKR